MHTTVERILNKMTLNSAFCFHLSFDYKLAAIVRAKGTSDVKGLSCIESYLTFWHRNTISVHYLRSLVLMKKEITLRKVSEDSWLSSCLSG